MAKGGHSYHIENEDALFCMIMGFFGKCNFLIACMIYKGRDELEEELLHILDDDIFLPDQYRQERTMKFK